jgi:hypothetical protein
MGWKPQKFTIKVDADKLFQSGALSDGLKIEENWERVKLEGFNGGDLFVGCRLRSRWRAYYRRGFKTDFGINQRVFKTVIKVE